MDNLKIRYTCKNEHCDDCETCKYGLMNDWLLRNYIWKLKQIKTKETWQKIDNTIVDNNILHKK